MNELLMHSKKKKQYDICRVFTIYWVVLIIWQNAVHAETRSTADALLKVCLLGYLTFSFFKISTRINAKNSTLWLLFVFSQLMTFWVHDMDNLTLATLVYYVYPSLLIFLVYCVGNRFIATRHHMERMNNVILTVLVVSMIYTIVYEPNQYIAAITARTTAYGNELTSFFISMHEYAQYLFYGIVVCLNRINDRRYHKGAYIFLLIALGITLICTFSRTAIAGGLAYILIYLIMGYKTKMGRNIFVCLVLGILIVVFSPSLSEYIYKIVWKSGHSSARETLYSYSINYFMNSSVLNQVIGSGITDIREHFSRTLGYASVHNGILQVMLYYGIVGLIFLFSLYIQQFLDIIRFFKVDKRAALFSMGMLAFSFISILPNTMIIFTSSIECYFMTIMMIIIPKYQRNAIRSGKYDHIE